MLGQVGEDATDRNDAGQMPRGVIFHRRVRDVRAAGISDITCYVVSPAGATDTAVVTVSRRVRGKRTAPVRAGTGSGIAPNILRVVERIRSGRSGTCRRAG
jgi:hypothetical protein